MNSSIAATYRMMNNLTIAQLAEQAKIDYDRYLEFEEYNIELTDEEIKRLESIINR